MRFQIDKTKSVEMQQAQLESDVKTEVQILRQNTPWYIKVFFKKVLDMVEELALTLVKQIFESLKK